MTKEVKPLNLVYNDLMQEESITKDDLPKNIKMSINGLNLLIKKHEKNPADKSADVINKKAIEIADNIQTWIEETHEETQKQEAEEKEKQEAEAKAKQEAEEKEKQEAEAKAKQEAEEKEKQEAEAKAKQEAEEKEKQEAEAKAKQEAEEKEKQEAEGQFGNPIFKTIFGV